MAHRLFALSLFALASGCGVPVGQANVSVHAGEESDLCATKGADWHAATQEPVQRVSLDQCEALGPVQRISGVWVDGFEKSQFLTEAQYASGKWPDFDRAIWVEVAKDRRPHGAGGKPHDGGTYRVTLIARRSVHRGFFGHMGLYDGRIVVERFEKIERIAKR